MDIWSAAVSGAALGALGRERRGELLRRVAEGALPELEFEAIVFRAGPNRNHLRIAAAELPAFAASFVGVPFLRDHAVESLDARAGIVVSSVLDGPAIRQTIRLTTQRDIARLSRRADGSLLGELVLRRRALLGLRQGVGRMQPQARPPLWRGAGTGQGARAANWYLQAWLERRCRQSMHRRWRARKLWRLPMGKRGSREARIGNAWGWAAGRWKGIP